MCSLGTMIAFRAKPAVIAESSLTSLCSVQHSMMLSDEDLLVMTVTIPPVLEIANGNHGWRTKGVLGGRTN